jgi:hypothetical protein
VPSACCDTAGAASGEEALARKQHGLQRRVMKRVCVYQCGWYWCTGVDLTGLGRTTNVSVCTSLILCGARCSLRLQWKMGGETGSYQIFKHGVGVVATARGLVGTGIRYTYCLSFSLPFGLCYVRPPNTCRSWWDAYFRGCFLGVKGKEGRAVVYVSVMRATNSVFNMFFTCVLYGKM